MMIDASRIAKETETTKTDTVEKGITEGLVTAIIETEGKTDTAKKTSTGVDPEVEATKGAGSIETGLEAHPERNIEGDHDRRHEDKTIERRKTEDSDLIHRPRKMKYHKLQQ